MSSCIPSPFAPELTLRVRYECPCGTSQPISRLYFCRHCLEPRCPYCVSHEVDSHFCPNCLENMPSAEARLKKNRCANCFDCPSCGHTLSTRATSVQVPMADDPDKVVNKKVYYLACAFCRWTSRDIGMKDQSVASGGWPELENPHANRLAQLQDHYRSLAQREKIEKEGKRFLSKRLSYMQLSDKYGLTRRRAGLPPMSPSSSAASFSSTEDGKSVSLAPAESKPIEEIEVLPEEIFEKEVDLCQVTTLAQRLAQVDTQPELVKNLFPKHKYLMIKRSQRCRKCEHNLSKPEYSPSSIKFKIQLAAYYHVPDVIIFKLKDDIKAGANCEFVLRAVNPTQHGTHIEILDMVDFHRIVEEKKKAEEEAEAKEDKKKVSIVGVRNPSLVKATALQKVIPNAVCLIPKGQIYIPPRDDAAEFDDAGPDLKGVVDDPNVVDWRKANRVGIKMVAKVNSDVKAGEQVVTTVALKYVYTNTISALEQKEVQKEDIVIPINIVLGTAN